MQADQVHIGDYIARTFDGVVRYNKELCVQADKVHIGDYIARTFDGVAQNSHLKKDNYFYYNCLMGKFTRENCPSYLKEENFKMLKEGGTAKLDVVTGTFLDALRSDTFTKVILMDHVDWLDETQASEVAQVRHTHLITVHTFTKVILMDHVDWLDETQASEVAQVRRTLDYSPGLLWFELECSPTLLCSSAVLVEPPACDVPHVRHTIGCSPTLLCASLAVGCSPALLCASAAVARPPACNAAQVRRSPALTTKGLVHFSRGRRGHGLAVCFRGCTPATPQSAARHPGAQGAGGTRRQGHLALSKQRATVRAPH